MSGPKVLIYDIETAPIIASVWGLWDQNVSLSQIKTDWHLLSWAAKWLGEPEVMYQDQRKLKNKENDKKLLSGIWKLLDEADIVVTQNGKNFDEKKLNARFILQGFKPPSPVKHIDTCEISKRKFGFTSNKLEYTAGKLSQEHKKLKTKEFQGFELWTECLKGNQRAWREMERYNKADVLATEAVYRELAPWTNTVNFNLYRTDLKNLCSCGSSKLMRNGYQLTPTGKYQRYRCTKCGAYSRGRFNLLPKDKKASLQVGIA